MADDDKQQEPSMDEILSSIRRTVSSEDKVKKTETEAAIVAGESDADTDLSEKQQEPSMDEILSSIRRVVSSEEEGDKVEGEEAIVPATLDAGTAKSEKQEAPSMDDILSSIRRVVSPEEKYEKSKSEVDIVSAKLEKETDPLSAEDVVENGPNIGLVEEEESGSSVVGHHQKSAVDIAGMKVGELGVQLMQPMLLEWLNQNLPPMVERLVRAEVDRLKKETE